MIHTLDVLHEVNKLQPEDFQGMAKDLIVITSTLRYKVQLMK